MQLRCAPPPPATAFAFAWLFASVTRFCSAPRTPRLPKDVQGDSPLTRSFRRRLVVLAGQVQQLDLLIVEVMVLLANDDPRS